jgi:hypothetical protein
MGAITFPGGSHPIGGFNSLSSSVPS